MNDSDLAGFSDTFQDLLRIFPKRLEEFERGRLQREYFKTLRRFSLRQVQDGAETWIQRGRYFPKPAEWIDAIPARRATATEIPAMNPELIADYERAEQLRYEDAPCGCAECRAAEVSERPLRFVPEFNRDDRPVLNRLGERIVAAGHWAHGFELARWYRARADFYNRFQELLGRTF